MMIRLTIKAGAKVFSSLLLVSLTAVLFGCTAQPFTTQKIVDGNHLSANASQYRERISLNTGWRFYKYKDSNDADTLIYDIRPKVGSFDDRRPADAKPTERQKVDAQGQRVLKPWILPTANAFIKRLANHHTRPETDPGSDFAFVQHEFDDSHWEKVSLPHDWAIAGPFFEGDDAQVGGGMGRLPSPGVAWYRKSISVPESDKGKRLFLDVDGAMSYAMVWVNGRLAGGWPYGYASWRVDLTPYIDFGGTNQLAIRIDNPPDSSRWYPGGGLYRSVWLVKTNPVHIAQWGNFVRTPKVSEESAEVVITTSVTNRTGAPVNAQVATEIYPLDQSGSASTQAVAKTKVLSGTISPGSRLAFDGRAVIVQPALWGPPPSQSPHLYLAVTTVTGKGGKLLDQYHTRFGVRSLEFDGQKGLMVNGEHIPIKGVNQHHDLGALGAAFNKQAALRQLLTLKEMGVNAIRIAHNPPDPQLLDLTDELGLLVVNEIFDSWERKKTPLDFHLIFPDWHEPDLRAFIRRDRNHPSVIMWSIGNEVGEQYTGEEGAKVARRLHQIAKQEDPTRPTTLSMNYAKPDMPIAAVTDVINLNYQGEGIRNAPAYKGLKGITTEPLYPAFHQAFPDKLIISSENAAAVSSRGEYLFPVTSHLSAPVKDGDGGDPSSGHVSSYELYTAPFGSSADKVLASLSRHPYVGGGFVWSGWDYLGEPTPYYSARSSYFGVVDLAGFKKDRFFLYKSAWRPEVPLVHVLPHWNWPDRVGKQTPVHVFTSGDEVELFLNGISLGRKQKKENQYRLRWDDVRYQPGELEAVAYKNGEFWAQTRVTTTGPARALSLSREPMISHDDKLVFVRLTVVDEAHRLVPNAKPWFEVEVDGAAELVAIDNGDPTDLTPFSSKSRKAFNGRGLIIIRPTDLSTGEFTVKVHSKGLEAGELRVSTDTSLLAPVQR